MVFGKEHEEYLIRLVIVGVCLKSFKGGFEGD